MSDQLSAAVLEACETLAALIDTRAKIEAEEKAIRSWLTDQHDAGLVPTTFTANGFSYRLQPGRTTWTYPNSLSLVIKNMQAAAQEDGSAVRKQGDPFWTVKSQ